MKPPSSSRAPLAFLFMTIFIDMIGYGMVIPLLPFYVQEQAAGALVVGSLSSLYAGMQFFSTPVMGSLSDRYGRRPVLLIVLLGTGMAHLLLGMAHTLWLIFTAVLLNGLTGGSLTVAQAYIADRTSPDERARGLGLIGAAFGIGLMVGPAFGGLLSIYGLGTPAFVAAAMAFSNAAFGFLRLPESLPLAARKRALDPHINPLAPLLALLRVADLRPLLLTIFLLNLAFAGLHTNFPLFSMARFGWDAFDNGFFFGFVGICAALTQGVLLGYLQPRLGEMRLVLGGLFLMSLTLGLVALLQQAWLLYPLVGLLAMGTGLAIPAVTSLISQQAAAHEQGRVLGGMNGLLSLTMVLGPLLAGLAFDEIAITAPYVLGSLLALLALLVALNALRSPRQLPRLPEAE